jgi:hypothetical protein
VDRTLTLTRVAGASPVAIALLILANLVPLAGVLWFGWDLVTLVAVYWAENGVVGVFAVGRILTAARDSPAGSDDAAGSHGVAARLVLVPFFVLHYGTFWVVHGIFVWFALPMVFSTMGASPPGGPDLAVVLTATFALLASHGASFVLNWILGGEYRTSSASEEMGAPYARVIVLHMTIILGAFAVAIVGAPIGALVVMVVLKTVIDLSAHLAERRRAANRRQRRQPGPVSAGLDAPAA